jgi:hypothetical protein
MVKRYFNPSGIGVLSKYLIYNLVLCDPPYISNLTMKQGCTP